nr:glycerol-3-phosphate acyltransferase [Oscillospiraceae bacterium]
MKALLALGMGYAVGCISPAAWVSKKKNVNLKQEGTKNLGATNTALVMGRKAGYFVLFFDMFKSVFSYKLARFLFPQLVAAGIIACIGVILGHCFPVFMHFQGGKGLAAFGGLVLAHSVRMFLLLLSFGIVVAFILDYGVYLAVSAAALFPILNYLRSGNVQESIIAAIASTIIIAMHWGNLRRAITREDPIHTRDGLKKIFGRSK